MATVELKKTPTEPTDQDTDDVKYAKSLGSKALVGVATYPLTFAKTLFQLGYEPYPLSTGRVFIAFGREAYFLPNALKYIRNIYVEHGALALWRGAEAGFVGTLVGGTASYVFEKYIDEYYPEIGGKNDNVKKAEEELDDYESFQVHFRTAIRQTLTHTVGLIAQRPLTVLMVREIAQHIGGESKYPNFFTGILRVGEEEGPGGLFSGLIPALITDFILVWGVNTLSYAAERLLLHAERNNRDDKQAVDTIRNLRKVTNVLVPFVVSGWSYPFAVCSTVMSVTGSNLVVSLLPYAPLHGHWTDAYHYLKPHGLQRGARLFLREQKGAVSVGADHQLYASNKFFIYTTYAPIARYAKPGQNVAVLGIGGLGHMAVMYAKAWGCHVTGFTSSKDKEEFIKKLGADKVVVTSPETLKEEESKYHLVINTLPIDTNMTEMVKLTKPLGHFCQVGLPAHENPGPFSVGCLVDSHRNFCGSVIGSRREIKEMLEFSAKHRIVPMCEQFEFKDFEKAYDHLVNGKPKFRCVVRVEGSGPKKQ